MFGSSLRNKGGVSPRGHAGSQSGKHSGLMNEAESYSPKATKHKRSFYRRHYIGAFVAIALVVMLWDKKNRISAIIEPTQSGESKPLFQNFTSQRQSPNGKDRVLRQKKPTSAAASFESTLLHQNLTSEWPRIIHQSWRANDIPITAGMNRYVQTWMGNPCHHAKQEWKYQFWNNEDNELFIAEQLPDYLKTYQDLNNSIARADFSRYAYLYVMGGVYADLDFECVKNFEELLKHPDVAAKGAFLSSEPWPQSMLMYGDTHLPCNAIMGSKPKHLFWKRIMDTIRRDVQKGTCGFVVECTGPMRLQKEMGYLSSQKTKDAAQKKIQKALRESVVLLTSDYFYPLIANYKVQELRRACLKPQDIMKEHKAKGIKEDDVSRSCEVLKTYNDKTTLWTSNTYAAHHWGCTWCHPTRSGHGATSYAIEELVNQPGVLQRYKSTTTSKQ